MQLVQSPAFPRCASCCREHNRQREAHAGTERQPERGGLRPCPANHSDFGAATHPTGRGGVARIGVKPRREAHPRPTAARLGPHLFRFYWREVGGGVVVVVCCTARADGVLTRVAHAGAVARGLSAALSELTGFRRECGPFDRVVLSPCLSVCVCVVCRSGDP